MVLKGSRNDEYRLYSKILPPWLPSRNTVFHYFPLTDFFLKLVQIGPNITDYTDGSAKGNPGPWRLRNRTFKWQHRKEVSEGFRPHQH